jgi:RHS repeat-associated protein
VVGESFSGGTGAQEESHAYVYGLDRISQKRQFTNGAQNLTQLSYYIYDGHGSVRALTDPSGNVTDTYDYDAFGNLIHTTTTQCMNSSSGAISTVALGAACPAGSTPSPTANEFLFAGEQFDSDLHLYYNRARYLNTTTGRFWTMDTDEGDAQSPLSLHKYLYADSDPVDGIDPSGNDELALQLGSFSVGQVIATIAVLSFTGVCAAMIVSIGGPGFCGSKNQPLILYRGLSGKNPGQIKPEYFSGDGLSLYETLYAGGYKFKLPFVIDYRGPKTEFTQAENIYVPPFLNSIANITYTPQLEDPSVGKGHWSLQLKLGIALTADILKALIEYMKGSAVPF